MKRVKFYVKILFLISILFLYNIPPSFSSSISVSDDETVYAITDSNGSIKKTVVIDWIRVEGNGEYTVYDSIVGLRNVRKLLGDGKISVDGNNVKIEGKVDGISDVYYRGETDKKLPVSLSVAYYLNNKKIQYKDAKGKNGTIKVEFVLKNKTINRVKIKNELEEVYTPFTAIITTNFHASKIKDIRVSSGGTVATAGSNITVNLMGMPQPDFKGWIEISMDKISLDSIQIVLIPSSPALAGLLNSISEYMSGIEQIDQILKFQQDLLKQMAQEIGVAVNGNNQEKSLDNIGKIKDSLDMQIKSLNELDKSIDRMIERNKKMINLTKDTNNEGLLSLLEEEKKELEILKSKIKSLKESSLEMYRLSSDIPLDSIKNIIASLSRIQMSLNAIAEGGAVGFVMIPGLNMVREGIKTAKSEIEKNKEKMNVLERLAKKYNSFIGRPRNAKKSNVKFVYHIKFE
ncbi:MAG: hypothetical protein N2380_01695 [bacterium]|nr:hypothetical protein [bacterium]